MDGSVEIGSLLYPDVVAKADIVGRGDTAKKNAQIILEPELTKVPGLVWVIRANLTDSVVNRGYGKGGEMI